VERAGNLERLIDLPRSIVWDALLDPVLVEGWLHPTARLIAGELRERVEPAPGVRAVLDTVLEPFGRVRVELDERDGGTRGSSTFLRLEAAGSGWEDRIDGLENLLRGHPVEWGDPPAEERHA
jgi:hypothetical protein